MTNETYQCGETKGTIFIAKSMLGIFGVLASAELVVVATQETSVAIAGAAALAGVGVAMNYVNDRLLDSDK